MKKYLVMGLSLILMIALFGCANLSSETNADTGSSTDSVVVDTGDSADNVVMDKGEQTYENTKVDSPNKPVYTKEHVMSVSPDYVSIDLNEIFDGADLVVRAILVSETETHISSGMLPVTRSKFKVNDVLKGIYEDSDILIDYYGGTVSMYEYMQAMPEAYKAKGGFDYTDEEAKQIGITYSSENAAEFEEGQEYVICLGHDKSDDPYMVLAEAYGISKITDGQVYNLAEKTTINLTDLSK